MDPILAASLIKGGSTLAGGITDYFGNKAKMDAERRAINAQMDAEKRAQGIGQGYYQMLEGQYGPEAANYMSDLNAWRELNQQAPIQLGNFDESKYNINAYLDPSMDFQQGQARKAIEQSAAARGGMFAGSGATAKALQDRATELAQTDYANAYGRMGQDRQFGYNAFTDKFKAARDAEQEKISRYGNILDKTSGARDSLLQSRGGLADLNMSSERTLGDLVAGKKRAEGDFYQSTWKGAGNIIGSAGNIGSSALGGGQGAGTSNILKGLGIDINSLSQDDKMSLARALMGGN